MIPEKKTKTTSTLVTTFFKPLSSDGQAKVTNADTTTNCIETACSDSTCFEDSVSKSEPEASQMSISESIETQRNCSDSDLQSVQSSNMPEIPKGNSFYSKTRSSAVIDGTITDDKLSFTVKWETRFTWAYYSSYHAGRFVGPTKNILIHMTSIGKQFPEPTISIVEYFFSEHENCQKHIRAVTDKSNIKKLLAKGNIVCQISKGAESRTGKEIKNNQISIKKFIKTISFLAKKKWAVKNNFEETISSINL